VAIYKQPPGAGNFGSTGDFLDDNEFYDERNNDEDNDFYSRNGNVVDNRSTGSRRGSGAGGPDARGAPGRNQNYYDIGADGGDRRMDGGGGITRYTPNTNTNTNYNEQQPNKRRAGGGVDGYNSYDVNVNSHGDDNNNNDFNDDEFDNDSSGSFYNNEGKRVRRFDPNWDRPDSYFNPDHLSNDSTDPNRIKQNKRRSAGRDVSNGASLRRYDPEWDAGGGLYDEDALYGGGVKSTRNYVSGYGGDRSDINNNRRQPNSK
jgi:hypothetical protein